MIQLADISRPGVLAKELRGPRVKPGNGFAITLGVTSQEMVSEEKNILAALPERRQMNLDGVQTKKEVLPEAPGGGFGVYVGVGCGQNANVNTAGGRRAHTLDFPRFQHRKKVFLQNSGQNWNF